MFYKETILHGAGAALIRPGFINSIIIFTNVRVYTNLKKIRVVYVKMENEFKLIKYEETSLSATA